MKVVNQKDEKNKPIISRSVVFQLFYISGQFGTFPSGFVVANKTEKIFERSE